MIKSSLLLLLLITTIVECTITLKQGRDTVSDQPVTKVVEKDQFKPHDLEAEVPHFVEDATTTTQTRHAHSNSVPQKANPNAPIQLVRPSADHSRLEIIEENLSYLTQINEPVSIIGVLGPYHSGKSFLLNSLLEDTKGFTVGPSTDIQTKGIWVRNTGLVGNDFSRVLLLDTEGFFGSNVDELYDAKVFAISTLLSSHLLYNSIKIIDQAAVEYLELLARRTQLFQFKIGQNNDSNTNTNDNNNDQFTPNEVIEAIRGAKFPSLTWVVRDFTQRLAVHSPQDWLNNFLAGRRDKSTEVVPDDVEISKIFNGIDCVTLGLPALNDMSQLEDLSELKHTQLLRSFRSEVWRLREDILRKLQAKLTSQGKFTGPSIAALLKFLVYAANQNKLPELPSMWNNWLKIQGDTAAMDSIQQYEKHLSEMINGESPIPEQSFIQHEKEAFKNAVQFFKDSLFNHEMAYRPGLANLETYLKEKRSSLSDLLNHRISSHVTNMKDRLVKDASEKLNSLTSPVDILNRYTDLTKNSVEHYIHNAEKYFSKSAFNEELEKLKREITGIKDSVLLKSYNNLNHFLDKAELSLLSAYESFVSTIVLPVNPEILTEKYKNQLQTFHRVFDEYINDPLMKKEDLYKHKYESANKKIEDLFGDLKLKNEEKINQKALAVYNQKVEEFEKYLSELTIPQEDSVLSQLSADYGKVLLSQYDNEMIEFTNSKAFSDTKDLLQLQMHTRYEKLDDDNFSMWRLISADVFTESTKRIERSRCSFCLNNLIPFVYDNQAIAIANQMLDSNEITSHYSTHLRGELIDYWMKNDLYDARNEVRRNCLILCGVSIFLIGLVINEMNRYFKEQRVHRDHTGERIAKLVLNDMDENVDVHMQKRDDVSQKPKQRNGKRGNSPPNALSNK